MSRSCRCVAMRARPANTTHDDFTPSKPTFCGILPLLSQLVHGVLAAVSLRHREGFSTGDEPQELGWPQFILNQQAAAQSGGTISDYCSSKTELGKLQYLIIYVYIYIIYVYLEKSVWLNIILTPTCEPPTQNNKSVLVSFHTVYLDFLKFIKNFQDF